MASQEYTNKTIGEILAEFDSSEEGLSKKKANLALAKFGPNEVKIKNANAFNILIRQFKSPFAYLLLIAGIISLLIGEKADSIAIFAFIILNAAIGFFQEYKAEKAIFLLEKIIPQKVKVVRDGKKQIIEKKFLVPGDVVILEAGDMAPADLRAIKLQNFLVNESVLTGESIPVSKDQKDMIFSGTSAISGKATAIAVATGKDTVFGGIVKLAAGIKRESTYEKSILYFCRLILKIVVVTISLIFIANILLKGVSSILELVLFSVALIVSILPEALPAVVTFALSEGSLKMAKQNVVVKRLSAIEDMGNVEVLCTDKTGTLTQNKLALEETVSSDKKKCLLYGVLGTGSPFDAALNQRAPNEILNESKKFEIISEMPFDSYRMRSAFLAESKHEKILIVKGAPESIFKNCSKFSGNFERKELKEETEKQGMGGKRVLALAFKKVDKDKESIKVEDEKGLTFLGYFVFSDPVKPTAKEAISLAKKLGVKIKIITGDSKEVAGYVARQTGLASLEEEIISGPELEKLILEEFEDACEQKTVFARISPDLKHKIIKSLQKRYEVGFMGEGVNDAPALKTADVGIAVAEASDIARDTADVILLQKDLRVVVNGIKDGRMIFSNINKYIKCALASNFGNFYSIAVISLFVNFLPMLPVQILLGNILSDFPLISIATDSVDIEELRKPRMYQLHNVLPLIISLALVSTVFDFLFFSIFYRQQPGVIQTLWFIESILTEIILIYIIRTRKKFWKAKKPSLWLLSLTIIDGIFIIILPFLPIGKTWFHFVTPPILPLLLVFFLVGCYFAMSEWVKLIYFKYWKTPKSVVE